MKDKQNQLLEEVKLIGDGWKSSQYYENVENMLKVFWGEDSRFLKRFETLDLSRVLELACGHGRHTEQIKKKAKEIILMDYNQENIDFCKERFKDQKNVDYFKNNGLNFQPIPDSSLTAIFCYDAMVHFDHRNVLSYLEDTLRVLAPGGRALYHHSNNSYPFATHYGQNPHSRNFMTKELFARYCMDCGLKVLDQTVFGWGGGKKRVEDLDCLTLLEKQ
tara:strand:- start:1125 stop:1781 length:657 start_codon:yes stop_codon:yes gene_type:complete